MPSCVSLHLPRAQAETLRVSLFKAAALGEIKMVAVRQRGALRGVRLVVYDTVADYVRRSAQIVPEPSEPARTLSQLPIRFEEA